MNEWTETKINAQARIEQDIIRYALVFLLANVDDEDEEDLRMSHEELSGTLTRMIRKREE
tara:strand:+ start:1548 stop:1727 length:180 start_codon:yes stop_codon:yes gene_type:complete